MNELENHYRKTKKFPHSQRKKSGSAPAGFLGAVSSRSRSCLPYRITSQHWHVCPGLLWTHLRSTGTNNRLASAGFFSRWFPAADVTSAALPPPSGHIRLLHRPHNHPTSCLLKSSKAFSFSLVPMFKMRSNVISFNYKCLTSFLIFSCKYPSLTLNKFSNPDGKILTSWWCKSILLQLNWSLFLLHFEGNVDS